jgi:nucleotide-binding universal stress UspA family protein
MNECRRLISLVILIDPMERKKDTQIEIQLSIQPCSSIGDAILEEQEKLRSCIVVIGRRGISHNKEFVFGSTSSTILHLAKHCAVMVVE